MKNRNIGIEEVKEKFGVDPTKVIYIQALTGDKVDNIPGAPGVGPKTALDLINQFGDIEGLIKNAEEIRECCKMVPSDRILVETDSPFLAPVPNRGKRNEPSFIIETLKQISEIKNVDVKEMAEITTNNFFKLFSKASINNDKK